MNCSLASAHSDFDCWEFYTERLVTAKKEFKCGECKQKFPAGTKYYRLTGKWDGDFCTYRTCVNCDSITRHLFKGGAVLESVWDDLRDHLYDCEGDISQEQIAKLTPIARDKVCDFIEQVWASLEEN